MTTADFSDIISGIETSEGLRTLNILSGSLAQDRIVELNLSDNALGDRGILACQEYLARAQSLERISFCVNGLSAEAMEMVATSLLYRGADVPTTLTKIHFSDNMSGRWAPILLYHAIYGCPHLCRVALSFVTHTYIHTCAQTHSAAVALPWERF